MELLFNGRNPLGFFDFREPSDQSVDIFLFTASNFDALTHEASESSPFRDFLYGLAISLPSGDLERIT